MNAFTKFIGTALILSSCGLANASELGRMFECYQGIAWYSWQNSYAVTETVMRKLGEDSPAVLLLADEANKGKGQAGIYVISDDTESFFPFPAVLNPTHDTKLKLDFDGDGNDTRSVWVNYKPESDLSGSIKAFQYWTQDSHVLKLKSGDFNSELAEELFAKEIVRFIKGVKETYDQQSKIAEKAPGGRLSPGGFLEKLELCGKIRNMSVQLAVQLEQQKFKSPSRARVPASQKH